MADRLDAYASTLGSDHENRHNEDISRNTSDSSISSRHSHSEPRHYLELTEASPPTDSWRSLEMPSREFQRDEDATPTSQVSSSLPGSHDGDQHNNDGASDGYFGPVLSRERLAPQLTRSSATASLVEPSSSQDAAISHLDLNHLARSHLLPQRVDEHTERPVPYHTISSSSTASTSTIRQSDFRNRGSSRPRFLPHFPDQSYSALHTQQHPSHHPPPVLRARSSNPSSYNSYIAGAKGQRPAFGSTPSKSRTADNSPSGSPGLFTPLTSPARPKSVHDDATGSYSSPFLHYTQRQVPKETHVADIDVDPISGRKIINQYEIVDELGRGVHGKVKLGRVLPNGEYVAIKIVERYSKKKRLGKNTSHEDKIKKEIAILKKARHPNIVSLLEVIDDPQRKKVYIVLEFVELGEIAWRTKGQDEINLIEYRRFLREVGGLDNDTEDVAQQEGLILEEARRKRQRERRRQWKIERDDRLHNRHHETWSFEHQGDEGDDSWDNLSRVSTGTAGSVRSHRSNTILEEQLPLPEIPSQPLQEISPPPPPMDNIETSDFATITGLPDAVELMKQMSSDQLSKTSGPDNNATSALQGTMYGAYEEDYVRGRTPSLAGSAGSLVMEDPHQTHVPDNFSHVPLMTIGQARNAFRDTVLGLEYLHFQGVIHRDVKPANLLQTKDHRVKISDFGVSYMGRERSSTDPDASESEVPDVDEALELAKTVGTPAFYAPELCQTNEDIPTPPVTQQIDVWALGVTLYCLIFGRVPFHDHNPFALMAKIADENVHLPKRRLKAVEERNASRPGSRGRMFQTRHNNKRSAEDLEYEDIDEDLHDLLRRLFIKDPRQRISLMEVKHHPWVLQGIANPRMWLEETDPAREDGTKIQVSREDVQEAVVPLSLVDKITSNFRRGIGTVTGALGLGRSSSTRTRAKSNAATPDSPHPPSAASSSSTISQDARRLSMRPDESIFQALRASKEPEHPLAQSLTASPELKDHTANYFPFSSATPRPASEASDADVESDRGLRSRPYLERAAVSSSGAASTKTVRQKDVSRSMFKDRGMGNSTFPALPSTPQALEPPDGPGIGGILGNAGRRLSRLVARSRDRQHSRDHSAGSRRSSNRRSVDMSSESLDDMHGEPSLGLSHAVASGMLKQPELHWSRPRSVTSSAAASPISSRAGSVNSPEVVHSAASGVSRQSSVSSASSARHRPATASREIPEHFSRFGSPTTHEQDYDRAREESFRRRIAEENSRRDKSSRPSSSMETGGQNVQACPPSPDDTVFYNRQHDEAASRPRSSTATTDPQSVPQNMGQFGRFITPSSSEDHFTGLSQSTSNPSIPSVVSADSSISPDFDDPLSFNARRFDKDVGITDPPSDSSTVHRQPISHRQRSGHEDDEGYIGDHAVESGDEDDDSDSDDNFLEIGRGKSRSKKAASQRSESISVPEIPGRQKLRRTTNSQRTARSGSNNTMQKVRSHSSGEEEDIIRPTTS